MIGSPLAVWLMARTSADGVPGVATTLMILGVIYFLVMAIGAFSIRVAPTGWRPAGWSPAAVKTAGSMVSTHSVDVDEAWKTPQFWLIWAVLCLNVTAGIAVISMASPMFQDVFGARLLANGGHAGLTGVQKAAIVAAAAGLVGLISLFNSLDGSSGRRYRTSWAAGTPTTCSSSRACCSTACCQPGGTSAWRFCSSLRSASS